ncbi:MAG TPA: DMT family transporter [Myxococcaceae bacterium]|nr:DMT family transporter [Myxococcaceae bacterium]
MTSKTLLLTAVAMVCFAGNSLLCRLALRNAAIDPASFTAVRLGSAALVMTVLARLGGQGRAQAGGWTSAAVLFVYAIAFSLAYVQVGAGLGALLLFGAVQLTMVGWGLVKGERPGTSEWAGLALAILGLLLLTHPSVSGSPLKGIALMLLAGVGWGIYSLRGRRAADPLQTTAANFARTVPLVAVMVAISFLVERPHLSPTGVAAGVASGAVTSGIGYVIWYRALSSLTALQAATVQLTVPVLAAAGGVLFLGERVTLELVGAAALILGGLAVVILSRTR